ncbi:ATP-binding protein [Bacillus safensis]|uniref:ATP-binding protein n=1 Tax=Bacillus safensis TaxID=561879 RepID=UPI000C783A08|nr:ATP-binding protein [Bacillus safensis]PLT36138.1 hypothetical protein CUU65_19095 [Bacillus safensis]
MESGKFTIEDSEIAELLGRQNFTTKDSAIYELIKNCYDAGAKFCNIYIDNDSIRIFDDGIGMNYENIKKDWMHVGKSSKGYIDNKSNRVLTGSKGVGRFATARLGNSVKIISKKENNEPILWETNWEFSSFTKIQDDLLQGTNIEITDLRDTWRPNDIKKLENFLMRAYKNEEMKVIIHYKQENPIQITPIFKNIKLGVNCSSKITLDYKSDEMKLVVLIESDEFTDEIASIIDINKIKVYQETFNMQYEVNIFDSNEDLENLLSYLGDFSAEFYFGLSKQQKDMAKHYMYKYNGLELIDVDIALYRNDFSISSLEGKKDWLSISSRARKSPAAASHLTGSWRVRLNQISGFVQIDKINNKNLKDLANRQGIEEDDYYDIFCKIIHFGLGRFEKQRQSIIRKIVQYRGDEKRPAKNEVLKEFLNKPLSVKEMSEEKVTSLASEIKGFQKEANEKSKVFKESEQKYKYDVRILNVLATQGLRASAIAHELHNNRNNLSSGYIDIVDALKEYGFWEELLSDEYTKVSYKNVPLTLDNLNKINHKLLVFLDIILNKIEKRKFKSKVEDIEETISKTIKLWNKQYDWVLIKFDLIYDHEREFKFSEDVIEVILDNLILNSIQHNELEGKLKINIDFKIEREKIIVEYKDNGIGLHPKYKKDARRILDVHETSRADGHGLGMWIINNTVHMYEGEVIDIDGDDGFKINFNLKG